MGRFNTGASKGRNPGPRSAVKAAPNVRVRTAQGALGYGREAQSELFLLAVSFMGGDKLLHESEKGRYHRLKALCADESVFGDEVWCYNFVNYLRNDAQLRTVAIVVACEVVRNRLANDMFGGMPATHAYTAKTARSIDTAKTPRNRQIIDIACNRADEPAEVLAYWTSQYGQSKYDGKLIPQPILAGVGDAAIRLWNEFSVLKYGGGNGKNTAVTMKDVLRLARPTPRDTTQSVLFGWITGTQDIAGEGWRGPDNANPLPMIAARQKLNSIPRADRIMYLFGGYYESF